MNIDSILKPFQRFGVHLGLDRIQQLLANLNNPHHQVPIIHVAGTNGKGSVCAYLSSVLTEAGYRVGRYISPHLIDWNERICLNEKPISSEELQQLLLQVQSAINPNAEYPTQFEVITAAAWLYFAQQKVDIAVIEVGLGGRLDATNVCDRPLVSIITSISREHWQNLGPTLADIAREKAGILKAGCSAAIGQLPPEAKTVVENRIQELGCPAIFPEPAIALRTTKARSTRREEERWAEYQNIEYSLPLLGDIQLANSALAIASLQLLQQQGWQITPDAIASGMAKTKWPGRLQWTTWKDRPLLIDGAHNPAAAIALRQYVDTLEDISDKKSNLPSIPNRISWVMGILSTKDHADIFKALLRPDDQLHLVPIPDHSSANPENLAILGRNICPELEVVQTYPDLITGLDTAITTNSDLVVLCGSLYLLGHFLAIPTQ
ncbi:bifunctional folylpolyglutamate synthase/dihydrofolate synthase [Argonema antarcticum]|uniref:bifunctional folylpolyglutamate synthase/dihydrofolate synthase n=1 Tax=Argonema antarcticum TaxID=2942763 RepID=UPI0020122385|nr:folylpolyglutamate synthase/dihydrofolate synthase family protein [Argonema antarcticum]MCL1474088.1 bifunctional folylpolyglutamate synthase/dihydrofolate synthase [Argonema antarcticum A004/B2]